MADASSLLHKRDFDFKKATDRIVELFGGSICTAAKFLLRCNKNLIISKIEVKPEIPGYAFIDIMIKPDIGDVVKIDGNEVIVTEENYNLLFHKLNVILPLKALDTNSPYVMYKAIIDVTNIIESSKENLVENLLKYDAIDLSDIKQNVNTVEFQLLNDPEFESLLEILTKPKELHIMGFDKNDLDKTKIKLLQIYESINKPGTLN